MKGAKEMAMTVAEQIKNEGMKQGMELGVKQGMELGVKQGVELGVKQGVEKTALKMLEMEIEMTLICQATGLSEAEIKRIAAQKEQKKWQ